MNWIIKEETRKLELTDNPFKVLAKEMYIGKGNHKRQVTDITHYDTIK